MKPHTLLIIAAAGATLTLSGCSTLKSWFAKNRTAAEETIQSSPATVKENLSLTGHWYIASVGKTQLRGIEDEWPYIEFAPDGQFYGSNGCNIINGTYTIASAQQLTLNNIATTMRLCSADSLEFPIARALDATRSYSISTSGSVRTLSLHNDRHLTVMTLRNSDIQFLNGAWQVTAIGSREVTNPDVRLVFDTTEYRLHGHTGCNILNGTITQDPGVTASVQFCDLATTRMACPPGDDTEQRLLIALEETAKAQQKDGTVKLLSSSGRTLITLTPLTKADF